MDNFIQAVENNNVLYCSLFFKKETDAKAKKKMANLVTKDGFYVAHWACFHDNVQLLLMLLHYGADLSCRTLKSAVRSDNKVGFNKGTTLLHACAMSDSAGCITALLEEENSGVDMNAKDELGRTALMHACSLGHERIVKALLTCTYAQKLNIDQKCTVNHGTWVRGATAVMHAARISADTVRLMLQHKADCSLKDDNGWTVAHYAAEAALPSVVLALVSHGVDFNVRSTQGSKRLVASTGEQRNYTQSGFTPLHVCIRFEHEEEKALECIDLFVGTVDVNAVDVRGWTALHWACYRSVFRVLRRLLDASIKQQSVLDLSIRSVGLVVTKVPLSESHDVHTLQRRPTSMYGMQRMSGMGAASAGDASFRVIEFPPGATACDLCCLKDAYDCTELLILYRMQLEEAVAADEKNDVDKKEETWLSFARHMLASYVPSELELFLQHKLTFQSSALANGDSSQQQAASGVSQTDNSADTPPTANGDSGAEAKWEADRQRLQADLRVQHDELLSLRENVADLSDALDATRKMPTADVSRLREELAELKQKAVLTEKALKCSMIEKDIENERLKEELRTLQLQVETRRDGPKRISFVEPTQSLRDSSLRASLLQESDAFSPAARGGGALLANNKTRSEYSSINADSRDGDEEQDAGWCCCRF